MFHYIPLISTNIIDLILINVALKFGKKQQKHLDDFKNKNKKNKNKIRRGAKSTFQFTTDQFILPLVAR